MFNSPSPAFHRSRRRRGVKGAKHRRRRLALDGALPE
nr:MAG TPA: hypothetical protein [Caudoviricetes sp.]